jgi:hypothetical protein
MLACLHTFTDSFNRLDVEHVEKGKLGVMARDLNVRHVRKMGTNASGMRMELRAGRNLKAPMRLDTAKRTMRNTRKKNIRPLLRGSRMAVSPSQMDRQSCIDLYLHHTSRALHSVGERQLKRRAQLGT